jgi:dihydroorotase
MLGCPSDTHRGLSNGRSPSHGFGLDMLCQYRHFINPGADMADYELVLDASELYCPVVSVHGNGVIGVKDGRISYFNSDPQVAVPSSTTVVDVGDGLLLPGLVDLHAHPAMAGSRFGIDPDRFLLPAGSTTVLSQGDAGARNVTEYIRNTVEKSNTRVKLAINFCANGESNPRGRFFSLDEASVAECVESIRLARAHIWGVSLNIAFIRGRNVDPLEVLQRGIRAAEQAGVPVMFGATKDSAVPLEDQLCWLRPGDVMTYCYHSGAGSIVQDNRVLDCAWEARERGVLFDVGDGFAAFGFDTAEAAIAEGFLPDTISSDFYLAHVAEGIDHDLPLVVSKLVASGMNAMDCWPRVTSVPAKVLGLSSEVGSLQPGASADFCVLKPGDQPEVMHDGHGATRMGVRWRPTMVIKSGEIVDRWQS